jgi:hypothetical protein
VRVGVDKKKPFGPPLPCIPSHVGEGRTFGGEGELLPFFDRSITTHYFIISIEFFASLFYDILRKEDILT